MYLAENNDRMCCTGVGVFNYDIFIYSLYTYASSIPFDGVEFRSALFSYAPYN